MRKAEGKEYETQIDNMIEVGLRRFSDNYFTGQAEASPFVLYEKYSRRDICHLMNCGKDLSSIMYGMKRIGKERDIVKIRKKMHRAVRDDILHYLQSSIVRKEEKVQ